MSDNWIKFDFDTGIVETCKNGHLSAKKVPYLKKHKEKILEQVESNREVNEENIPVQITQPAHVHVGVEDLSPEQLKEHKRLIGWSQEILMLDKAYEMEVLNHSQMVEVRQKIYDAYGMGRYISKGKEYGKGLKIFQE